MGHHIRRRGGRLDDFGVGFWRGQRGLLGQPGQLFQRRLCPVVVFGQDFGIGSRDADDRGQPGFVFFAQRALGQPASQTLTFFGVSQRLFRGVGHDVGFRFGLDVRCVCQRGSQRLRRRFVFQHIGQCRKLGQHFSQIHITGSQIGSGLFVRQHLGRPCHFCWRQLGQVLITLIHGRQIHRRIHPLSRVVSFRGGVGQHGRLDNGRGLRDGVWRRVRGINYGIVHAGFNSRFCRHIVVNDRHHRRRRASTQFTAQHLHRGTLGGAGMRQADQCITQQFQGAADGVGRPWGRAGNRQAVGQLNHRVQQAGQAGGRQPSQALAQGIQATAEGAEWH